MFDPSDLQRVREGVSLLDLAREHGVEMRRRSGAWWGLYPFHVERSGSFKISEKRNAYKCFGCQASGDVISFYLLTRGMDLKKGFPQAVRELAGRAGVVLRDERSTKLEGRPQGAAPRRRSGAELAAEAALRRNRGLAQRAASAQGEIVRRYPWPYADICEQSPISLECGIQQAKALLSIFPSDDLVWAGDVHHSIGKDDLETSEGQRRKTEVATHFRKARAWSEAIDSGEIPGPRVCGCSFRNGTRYTRSAEAVSAHRFLVIEHDKLSLDTQGAMLRWLREGCGLRLRAIVFTGGKSLHGWFDYPVQPREASRLRVMLCGLQEEETGEDGRVQRVWRGGLGFDAASWNAVQPWKVPGWPHPKTNGMCELVWFNPYVRAGGAA